MTDTAHTPTPWILQGIDDDVESEDYGCHFFIGSNLGGLIGGALPLPNQIHNHNFSRVEANAAHIVKCVNEAEAKDKRIAELEAALENDAARLKSINEKLAGWNDMTGNQRASFREFIWHAECETRAALAKAGEA